jgi:hypothetical protein
MQGRSKKKKSRGAKLKQSRSPLKKINIGSRWGWEKRRSRSLLKKKRSREEMVKILIILYKKGAGKNFLIGTGASVNSHYLRHCLYGYCRLWCRILFN